MSLASDSTLLIVRAEEDWTRASDPPPGKAIRLGVRSFLTIGGEWRLAFEFFEDESWGDEPGPDGFLMNRLMGHTAWTYRPASGPLEHLRFFAQLKHGEVYQRRGADRPPDIDRLDWNAAFVEFRARPRGTTRLTLRLGRQELHYGAARLISVREGPNTRISFDAALLRYEKARWRADIFYAFPNKTGPGMFDNGRQPGRKFRGIYATHQLRTSSGRQRGLDLYAFLDERPQTYFQGSGREARYSLGGRFFQRDQRLSQDFLWTWQWGDFAPVNEAPTGQIRAWTISSNTHYQLSHGRFRPNVNLFLGFATGDRDSKNPDIEAFRAPFPPGRYFGTGAPNGPVNVVFYRLGLVFSPVNALTIDLGFFEFWRQSLKDGAYGVPGIPLRPPNPSSERAIGRLFEIKATFPWNRNLEFEAEAAHFIAGSFLEAATPGEDMTFLGLKAVLKY